jgi:hypothetical protein
MLWNPTTNIVNEAGFVFGGMHYVYVMGSQSMVGTGVITDEPFAPAYDAGRWLNKLLNHRISIQRRLIMGTAMWVSMPLAVEGQEWLSNDVSIRLRVAMPYDRYYSHPFMDSVAMVTDTINMNYPMYTFSTNAVATITDDFEKAKSDLDFINVVPNPYYAYSGYEVNQLDNRIKITNLPRKCTVTIYTISGTFIRQFTKDSDITSIDWDLKNYAGIPIAGGMYVIHIKADDIGEKTIKWFGSMRPVDLNAF